MICTLKCPMRDYVWKDFVSYQLYCVSYYGPYCGGGTILYQNTYWARNLSVALSCTVSCSKSILLLNSFHILLPCLLLNLRYPVLSFFTPGSYTWLTMAICMSLWKNMCIAIQQYSFLSVRSTCTSPDHTFDTSTSQTMCDPRHLQAKYPQRYLKRVWCRNLTS